MKKTKNLTLSIQREFFEDILNGSKKHEYREIRPTNIGKYIELDDDGNPRFENDETFDLVTINYDTITLYTGRYSGKRPGIVVECLGAKTSVNDKKTYWYKGEEYYEAHITYKLGAILEKLNFENLKPIETGYDRMEIVRKAVAEGKRQRLIEEQKKLT